MLPLVDSHVLRLNTLVYTLLALAIVALAPIVSFGQGSTLERDAYTLSTSAGTNFGSATIVRVSGSGSGAIGNGYFRFKMTPSLPVGLTGDQIAKATVKLYVSQVTSPGTLDVYLVSGTWAENTLTYSSAPAPSGPAVLSIPITSATQGTYLVFDLTPQAKSWWSNDTTNFGITLRANASTPALNMQFDSRENLSTSHDAKMEVITQGVVIKYDNAGRPAASASNNGQIIFNTDTNTFQISNGSVWNEVSSGSFSGNLSGDVTGPQSATVIASNAVTNGKIANLAVTDAKINDVSGSKVTGNISGNAASITGSIPESQVTNLTTDLAGKASDSAVVHLAGTETITGAKTFSNPISGSVTGSAATITGSITGAQVSSPVANATNAGNANTVTNGVYTTGSYADPSWITSLAGTKITGSVDLAKSVSQYTTASRPAAAPANSGQIILNTTTNNFQVSDGSNWTDIASGSFSGSLAGDVTGTQSSTVVALVGGKSASSVASATDAANGATDANTVNALVKRDGSGNFSAGTITATLNGNATSITGNINGSQVTGNIAGNAASITGSITGAQVSSQVADALHATNADNATNAGNANTVTNGVYTTGSYADPSFITSLAGSKISGSVALADIAKSVSHYTTAGRPVPGPSNNGQIIFNSDTNTLQVSDGSNWTDIGAAAPSSFTGNLAGDVTGTQSATVVSLVGGQSASSVASATTAANGATDSNTANALVKRDPSGNFTAGTITANLNGNATGITGNINGSQVTGNIAGNAASITGSIAEAQVVNLTNDLNAKANDNAVVHLTGAETIAGAKTFSSPVIGDLTGTADLAKSVRHYTNGTLPAAGAGNNGQIIFNSDTNTLQVSDGLNWTDIGAAAPASFTGSLAGDVTGTQSATVVSLVGGQSASSVANATTAANGATDANTVNALVKRDASGNFSAGTITASLNGNATSITGNINGSQVTGNIAGNAASITGSITGAQVSSQVADALHATNADNATNAGNANTVTNGVYTTGSYADPSWITSLAGTKITGSVALADIAKSVSHYTTSGRPAAAPANNGQIIFNSDTNTLQVSDGSNWTDIGAAAPASFTGSLAGDVTGTQSATVVSSVGGQAASAVASATTAANGATDANTVNALVKRDGSGNFSAGTITATLNGNATSITGNINGSQVTGNIAGNAASITGSITGAQVSSQVADALHATNADNATNAGNASTVTNGVYTTGSYADPSFITSLAGSKITGSVALADIAKSVTHYTTGTRPTADGSNNGQIIFNSTTNTLQVSDGSNWTDIGAAAPASFTGSLAGDVTGTQSATVVSSVGGATAANVASATSAANAATSSNSSGAIVKRDASGNFAAGTISANLTGNVTGDVTGNAGTVTNGVYTTGDQTIGGNKTFSNPIIGSITGNAATASSATTAGNVTGTVAVANGGTGLTSGTSGGIPGYTAAGTLASSALLTNNALVLGGGAGATPKTSANFTTSGSTLNVGTTGATGALQLNGSTSGVVTIQPQAAAGTFNFNLPTTPGTAGQVLTSQGGGAAAMTWTTAGTGTVTNGATLSSGQLIVGNGGTSVTVSNLSGDVTTSGSTATTLANSGVTAGTYPRVTVDVKGRVTAGLPANVTIVTGTAVAFGGGAVVGNTVTATATCSAGTMVGGGANITGNSASNHIATVTTSFPSAANTWTVVATEVVHGGNGSPPSVTAYALCIQ